MMMKVKLLSLGGSDRSKKTAGEQGDVRQALVMKELSAPEGTWLLKKAKCRSVS